MKKILTILAMLGLGLSLQLGCEFDDDDDDWDDDDDIDMGVLSSPQDDYSRATWSGPVDQESLEAMMTRWPDVSKKAASDMIEKYGLPQVANEHILVWRDNGPWVYTIVSAHPVHHNFPMAHQDVLEQFINYKVPADKFDELAEFDGSVMCERTAGWISARCDKEAANFLALNLAHKIITDELSVEEAREQYAEAVKQLMNGEKPAMTQELQFHAATGGTEDPDTSVIKSSGASR